MDVYYKLFIKVNVRIDGEHALFNGARALTSGDNHRVEFFIVSIAERIGRWCRLLRDDKCLLPVNEMTNDLANQLVLG